MDSNKELTMRRIGSVISLIAAALLTSGLGRPAHAQAQDPNVMIEGARLWSDNCMRCHNARSPLERNDQDWKTIVIHMRARANLTKSEADKIVAYIQQVNLPQIPPSTPQDVPAAQVSDETGSAADADLLQSTPQDEPGKSPEPDGAGR